MKRYCLRKEKNYSMRIRKDLGFDEPELEEIASVSDALAHPLRLQLFRFIMQCNRSMQQVCNKDLVDSFDYSQSTISQHMKRLVKSGLIEVKRKDSFSYYYANLGILTRYLNLTKRFSV